MMAEGSEQEGEGRARVEPETRAERDRLGYLSRSYRRAEQKLAALETQLAELAGERDRALGEASQAREQVLGLRLERAFEREARFSGVPEDLLDLAFRAVPAGTISLDASGQVQGIDEALRALRQERPALFAAGSPRRPGRPGGGNPPSVPEPRSGPNSKVNRWLRRLG